MWRIKELRDIVSLEKEKHRIRWQKVGCTSACFVANVVERRFLLLLLLHTSSYPLLAFSGPMSASRHGTPWPLLWSLKGAKLRDPAPSFQSYVHSAHNACTNTQLSTISSPHTVMEKANMQSTTTWQWPWDTHRRAYPGPLPGGAPSILAACFVFITGAVIPNLLPQKSSIPVFFYKETVQISLLYWCFASHTHNVLFLLHNVCKYEHCHQI